MLPLQYYYPNHGAGIWSTPDGVDPLNKVEAVLRAGIPISAAITIIGQLASGKRIESPSTIARLIRVAVPICGGGFIFACASFISARVRDKNDGWNSTVGLIALYPLLRHFYSRSYAIAFVPGSIALTGLMRRGCRLGTITLEQRIPHCQGYFANIDPYLWRNDKEPGEPWVKYKKSNFYFGKF